MARHVIVDSSVLVAMIRQDDRHHSWAVALAEQFPTPWYTCDAAVSEAFFVAGTAVRKKLAEVFRRRLVISTFVFDRDYEAVLTLMEKYANVPMSLADACLVRMSETLADPVVLTTDTDFRIYRRHSRQVVPCLIP